MCPSCRARVEQARGGQAADAAARRVVNGIEAEFGLETVYEQEATLEPGAYIQFSFEATNRTDVPVSGLKVIVRPAGHLRLVPRRHPGYSPPPAVLAAEKRVYPLRLRQLTTTGLPLRGSGGAPVPPTDRHFGGVRTRWGSAHDAGFDIEGGFGGTPGSGFHQNLVLSPALRPGRDVRFTGYITYRGVTRRVGQVTVHVVAPRRRSESATDHWG